MHSCSVQLVQSIARLHTRLTDPQSEELIRASHGHCAAVVRPSVDGQSVDVVRAYVTTRWRIFGFRSRVHGQMSNTAGGRAFELRRKSSCRCCCCLWDRARVVELTPPHYKCLRRQEKPSNLSARASTKRVKSREVTTAAFCL